MMPPALSVVIPAYHEARRIAATVETVAAYLGPRRGFELLVVDDGSADGTGRAVEAASGRHPEVRLIRLPQHRGKGAAVREGVRQAIGEVVCFTDADLSVPVDELEPLLDALAEGCDAVLAARTLPASVSTGSPGPVRRVVSALFNLAVRALFHVPFRDTQCGFKGFRREAARAVCARARIDGFVFDVEWLILADRLGYRLGEIPVRYRHSRASSVRLVAHAPQILADLWRLWSSLRAKTYRLPAARPTPAREHPATLPDGL